MANKNTNPVGGKTAIPADINNAQPAYFPKPHLTWEGQHPRCPHPQPETAQNAKIKLSAKTAQYRNQISTLLGASPLKFHRQSTPHHIMSRTPLPLLHKHTNRYKGVYLARCRIL